ncbi:MAG: tRNA (guanosine(46)-N7)-methyltransferase TrmB [Propionibacteriaceae bacterium]
MAIRRDVVSFVRRSPRMNPGQVRALETLGPQFILDLPHDELDTDIAPGTPMLDFEEMYGRPAPLYIELGSGRGETALAIASAHPDCNYLAFEVFIPGVASSLIGVRDAGLSNVRFAIIDGAAALRQIVPDRSVRELRVFFPDPWQKKRHAKRRLIQTAFATEVARVLEPGGKFFIATDWEDYALHARDVLDQHPGFTNSYDGWAPRDPERPLTKFEKRGIDAGRQIFDLVYQVAA